MQSITKFEIDIANELRSRVESRLSIFATQFICSGSPPSFEIANAQIHGSEEWADMARMTVTIVLYDGVCGIYSMLSADPYEFDLAQPGSLDAIVNKIIELIA